MKAIGERQWIQQNEKGIANKDYYNIALKQFSDGKYDECIKSLELAKTLSGSHDFIYHLTGLAYFKQQDYINSIKHFNIAINNYKLNTSQIYYERGLARYHIGDYEGSIKDFNIAEKQGLSLSETNIVSKEFIDYKHLINTANRETLYPIVENFNVMEYFVLYPMNNTAIKLTKIYDIKNINLHKNEKQEKNKYRAFKLFNENLLNDDIEKYNEIIKLNHNFIEAYNNRGCLYLKEKKYTDAIKDFAKAIEINTNCKEAMYNLALSYYLNKDYSKAVSSIDKYFRIESYTPIKQSTLQKLANLISGTSDFDSLVQKRYYMAQMLKGNALLLAGNIEGSNEIFNASEFISIYGMGHSLILLNCKEHLKAIKSLKSFLDYEYKTVAIGISNHEYEEKTLDYPINAYVYNNLAVAEYLRNNYARALKNTRRAKYVAFRDNNMELYEKIIKLENAVKSHLTQRQEMQTNKEYERFYDRNNDAITKRVNHNGK